MANNVFSDPVSVRDAARMLNVSPTRVQQFKRERRLNTDEKGKLSLAEIQHLLDVRQREVDIDRVSDSADAFERKRLADSATSEYRSELTRMELAVQSGQLVETEEVMRDATAMAEAICHTLDTLPSRVASTLYGQDEITITMILQNEMEAIKQIIKSGKFVDLEDVADAPEGERNQGQDS